MSPYTYLGRFKEDSYFKGMTVVGYNKIGASTAKVK
jgi:hypothetical protein